MSDSRGILDTMCPPILTKPSTYVELVWGNGPGYGPSRVVRGTTVLDEEAQYWRDWFRGHAAISAQLAMSELRSDARLLAQAKGSMDEDAARWRFRRNTILRERKLLLLGIAAELAERRNRWAKNERERERLKVPEPIVPEVRYDRSEVNGWHLNFMTLLSSSEDSWMFFHTDDPAACQCDDCKRTMLEVEARRLEGTQTLGIGRGYRDWQRRHPDRVVPRDPQAIVDRWAAVAAQPDAAEQGRLL